MTETKLQHPRVILNDDGSNFLYSWDDLGAEDLRQYLSRLAGTHVDMVAYCVAFGGYVCYYESEVAEPIGVGFGFSDRVRQRRWIHNRGRLRDEAGDYIGFVFGALREMGLPALASFRMNDAHMSSDPAGPVAGRFWMNHPEWRLGDPYGYYRSCLDYAVPAVRAYLRRLVQEAVGKFPEIDGIELDGLRSPFFFTYGKGEENAPLLTQLIREIRGDLDHAARVHGRGRYLLRVNVPRSPELALQAGMDVAAWDAERLIDGISPGCYNTDFQPVTEQWKERLSDRVPVHPYINCGPGTAMYNSLEQYRGAADNAYGSGADGVYLFNFPCLDELSGLLPRPIDRPPFPVPDFTARCWHPDLGRTHEALKELGDPGALARRDRQYLFYMGSSPYHHYTQESAFIDRLTPEPADLTFRCYHTETAAEVQLQIKVAGVTIRDACAFELNGRPITDARIRRLHAPGGRDARIHSIPLDPYSQYTLSCSPGMLRPGDNRLTVTLTEGEPDLFGRIDLVELELFLEY